MKSNINQADNWWDKGIHPITGFVVFDSSALKRSRKREKEIELETKLNNEKFN